MQIFTTSLGQMAVLFSFIFIGWLVAKLGVVDKSASNVLSKLENNIFIPALVLDTFANNFTVQKLGPAWRLFLVSAVLTVGSAFIAVGISKLASKDEFIRKIFTYGLTFSNFGFMGNAVVKAVFPELFLDYLIFTLPPWILIYMWGVPYLLVPTDDKKGIGARLKSFANPMFVAMLVGIVIGLLPISLPSWLGSVISVSGDCMSPIAMLLTGITLCGVNIKKIAGQLNVYAVSFIRLAILPLAAIGILYFFPQIPDVYVICIVCYLAMPLGLNTVVVPAAYGKDTSIAAGMTVISHILSCGSIPLIFMLMTEILK